MSFYVLVTLAALLINVFVLGIAYSRRRLKPVNRAFLLFTSLTALWISSEIAAFFLPFNNETRTIILRLSALAWMPTGIFFPHFALKLVGKSWNRTVLITISTSIFISAIIYVTTDLAVIDTCNCHWGYCPETGPWHGWLSMVPSLASAWGLAVIALSLSRTKDANKQHIYAMVLVGGVIALTLALILDIVMLDIIKTPTPPGLGSSSMSLFLIFIYAAVRRYNFLSITTEQFAEELFTDVGDGIVLIDKDSLVFRMNDAGLNLLGFQTADVQGKSAAVVLPDLLLDNDFSNRSILWQRGNEKRHLEISQTTISKDGLKLGQILTIRDITERKQAEAILRRSRDDLESEVARRTQELQQAQKMEAMGTLAGGIAHDFNNFLAAIIGFTQAAKDDLPPNSPLKADLSEVLSAGHKARDIVRQILTFSRRHDFYPKKMNIVNAVNDSVSLLQASLPSTIAITTTTEDDNLWIFGDPSKISQVVMNLCTNAFYAIGSSAGELAIELKTVQLDVAFTRKHPPAKPGEYVCLTISDNGCGMSEEVLKNAFDPFFTTKPQGEGTGLGLSTVYSIVECHNAAITAESEQGEGTRFDIYFPKTNEVAPDARDSGIFPNSSGNEHILVVDDEEALIRMLRRLIEPLGYKVTGFNHPAEAWTFYRENSEDFDMVITDQTMPQMTGIQLAEKIKAINPDIPIILISGYAKKTISKEADSVGINAFLHKPVSKKILSKTIRDILDQKTIGARDSFW